MRALSLAFDVLSENTFFKIWQKGVLLTRFARGVDEKNSDTKKEKGFLNPTSLLVTERDGRQANSSGYALLKLEIRTWPSRVCAASQIRGGLFFSAPRRAP